MRPQVAHGVMTFLVTAGLAVVVGAAGSASATTTAVLGPVTLPRSVNDHWAHRGPDAPVTGVVAGLTGHAAEVAAGDAAVRFRSLAAERARRLSAAVGGSGAAAQDASELHIGWGTAFAQPNGMGLRATHTVFTGPAAVALVLMWYAPTALPRRRPHGDDHCLHV